MGSYNESAEPDFGMENYNTSGLQILDAKDDAATVFLGKKWHLPTFEQIEELVEGCTWTWTTRKDSEGNERNCYLVSSNVNENSIFLPAAGSFNGSDSHDDNSCG